MKICILGPVTTERYFGGVATFDETLLQGCADLGVKAFVCTFQRGAPKLIDSRIFQVNPIGLAALARQERPDAYIASLHYGALYCIPGLLPPAKRAYYLHGFFNPRDYSASKIVAAEALQKYIARSCDALIANSDFTARVNEERLGARVDAVTFPGIDDVYTKPMESGSSNVRAPHSILFTGRLVEAKGVATIVHAVEELRGRGYEATLTIAGDGSEADRIAHMVATMPWVRMTGRADARGMRDLYCAAEVFVSLNDAEPFGMVFAEALCCGCKIVCPAVGGQVSFLHDFSDRVRFVHMEGGAPAVAEAIENLMGASVLPLDATAASRFDSRTCASGILRAIENTPSSKRRGERGRI